MAFHWINCEQRRGLRCSRKLRQMLDGVSLDQLRTFIAAADEGSFSAFDFLRAGFGFGFMPLHVVEADLASGALVQIAAEEAPPEGHAPYQCRPSTAPTALRGQRDAG